MDAKIPPPLPNPSPLLPPIAQDAPNPKFQHNSNICCRQSGSIEVEEDDKSLIAGPELPSNQLVRSIIGGSIGAYLALSIFFGSFFSWWSRSSEITLFVIYQSILLGVLLALAETISRCISRLPRYIGYPLIVIIGAPLLNGGKLSPLMMIFGTISLAYGIIRSFRRFRGIFALLTESGNRPVKPILF